MSAARPKRRPAHRAVSESMSGSSSIPIQNPPSGSPLSFAQAVFSGRALWVALSLIAAIGVVYSPVRSYDFVSWDDPIYVENPDVSGGLTWHSVWWALTTGHAPYWHPLTWLSHMLDFELYGSNSGLHHLTNVLIHTASTILLFGLLHRMTGKLGRSAFVAALFGLHPLRVESVAWVAERKDVLSTLFWMLTLWGYLWYTRQPRLDRYLAVVLLFAMGLMTKPMLVTLPFVLLLLDVWPLGRMSLQSGLAAPSNWAVTQDQQPIGQLVREKLPLLALSIASSIVTFVIQQQEGAVGRLDVFPLNLRWQNAVVSYVVYILQMLWPARLATFYPYPRSLPLWWVVGSILILIGVCLAVIRAVRRYPYLPVGWLWYLGTLAPVIGLMQAGSQSRADRFTYVPSIGLFLLTTWGIADLLARSRYRSVALPTATALVLSACMIVSRGQVRYWENSTVLWEHTLAVTTQNYLAHYNLGVALADKEKFREAILHYSEAIRIKPNYAEAHNNLGVALAREGRLSEAIAHYSEALRLNPDGSGTHNGLGNALSGQGRVAEAVPHYLEALRLKPDYSEAHYNLGNALARQGRLSEAIAHYTEALRIRPDYAEAHNGLGSALDDQGKFSEAIGHYREALRIQPRSAMTHNNLGVALAKQGNIDEAIQEFSEALRIRPDFADARNNLETMQRRRTQR